MSNITFDGVTKRYGDVTALDAVDLAIEPGTVHCILGPNGSGKTTLFDVLLGLTRPTNGTVTRPPGRVGCGFQEPNFYPDLTVAENLSVFARIAGAPDDGWVESLRREFGLERVADRTAGDLSGGYAKLLDLALAFLTRPQFVVLDEPLADLDDVSRERLVAFLDDYRTDERTVVVSTHRVAAFEAVADRLTVMDRGEVVLDVAAEDLNDALEDVYYDLVV